jgi:predicted O-methyltransferase YrrM
MHLLLQELGTYCGYSTILLAAHLKDPSAKVYTIDICEENVQIAKQMIAHAGLTDRVVHVVKPLDQAVEVRGQTVTWSKFDPVKAAVLGQ